jgi:cell wall-associated NlpC family hydrolase
MRPRRVYRYIVGIIFLVFLNGWGCTQDSQILSQKPPQQASHQKQASFRFGAINRTYADVYAQPDVDSERLTQCIYGDVIRIEQENGWWYSIKVGPYPELSGWIHKFAVTVLNSDAQYIRERNLTTIVIRQDISHVFVWPSTTINIVMGTELPFIGESEKWYLVRLPTNDIGRIARGAVYPSVASQPLIQSKQIAQSKQIVQPKQRIQSTQRIQSKKRIPSKQSLVLIPREIIQQRHDIVTTAQRFLGKVYVWGGTTPRGFDCSGLSYLVYKLNGIELPRVSWLQFRNGFGQKIKRSELDYGDLVFFQTYKQGASHVGIYVGNNQFIHASPTYGVTTSSLNDPYFRKRYIGAKTIFSAS